MVHVQALGAMRGQTILIGKVGVYRIGHAHFTTNSIIYISKLDISKVKDVMNAKQWYIFASLVPLRGKRGLVNLDTILGPGKGI